MYLGNNRGDGTLNNFRIRIGLVFLLLAPFTSACSASAIPKVESCVEKVSGFNVVRVDERNHRLFVTPNILINVSEDILLSKLSSCFKRTDWSNDWSVSLFSKDRFAGYKDEENIIPYHRNDQWAKAYLAEYDGAGHTVIKYPALPKQL